MANLKKYGNKESVKNILWIVLIIFILTLGYKVYAKFFGKDEPPPDEKLTDIEKAQLLALSNLHVDESALSINPTQAKVIADQLYVEVNSLIYVSYDTINKLFSPLGVNDIILVFKQWGVKKYKPTWFSSVEYLDAVAYCNKAISSFYSQGAKDLLNVYWHKAHLS